MRARAEGVNFDSEKKMEHNRFWIKNKKIVSFHKEKTLKNGKKT